MKSKTIAVVMSVMLSGMGNLSWLQAVQAAQAPPATPVIKTTLTKNTTVVELTMGKATMIHLNAPATKVSISDPTIVGIVMISPSEVELIGKTVGVANLLVWSSNNLQHYLTLDLSVHRDVSTLANKIQMIDPGINILPVGADDSVILTGVAESSEKAQLAYDLARAFFGGEEKPEAASSNSPGSLNPGARSTKIINLIRVMGQPTTKAELIQQRLKDIDPNIVLTVVPGFGGKEKAILNGHVKNASMVSKAVNLTSIFYGTPGIKVITGPGGNLAKQGADPGGGSTSGSSSGGSSGGGDGGGLIGNLSGNILYGSVITDSSGNVISMLEVDERPQVECRIRFLEMTKADARMLDPTILIAGKNVTGVTPFSDWANFLSAVSTGTGTGVSFNPSQFVHYFANETANNAQVGYLFNKNFGALLNGLVTTNRAKVLAEPKITSMSGEPASFLAGGEFPIPVLSSNGAASVQFQEYGIRLTVLPTVTDRGTIHIQISPEVSNLDFADGVTTGGVKVPALTTRRSQTVLEMKDGDNFVLSGLYSLNDSNDYLKTPFLGEIPILGALFRQQISQKNADELVIVIQPRIIWSDNSTPAPQTSNASTPEFSKATQDMIAGTHNPDPAPSDKAKAMLAAQTPTVEVSNETSPAFMQQTEAKLQGLIGKLEAQPPSAVVIPVLPAHATVDAPATIDEILQPISQKPKALRQPVITLDKQATEIAPNKPEVKKPAVASVKRSNKKQVASQTKAKRMVAHQIKQWQNQLNQFLTMGN